MSFWSLEPVHESQGPEVLFTQNPILNLVKKFLPCILNENPMTVYRTVQISEDQVTRFEKMMAENGFEIIQNEAPDIPLEVQREMERRAKNWDPNLAVPASELLEKLKARL
jgi:hypothetical protein